MIQLPDRKVLVLVGPQGSGVTVAARRVLDGAGLSYQSLRQGVVSVRKLFLTFADAVILEEWDAHTVGMAIEMVRGWRDGDPWPRHVVVCTNRMPPRVPGTVVEYVGGEL